jgi:hypothetical protein
MLSDYKIFRCGFDIIKLKMKSAIATLQIAKGQSHIQPYYLQGLDVA